MSRKFLSVWTIAKDTAKSEMYHDVCSRLGNLQKIQKIFSEDMVDLEDVQTHQQV